MPNAITLTVSQLNEYVKALLDSSELLGDIYIKGEISNFTNHYKSGHLYFSLKDKDSLLKCVMFRSSAQYLKFVPEDGMKVIVRGNVSVFQRDGVYQLYATEIQPDGVGSLYLAFEQLKEKLSAMGLFSEEYKKPIPRYPEKIGIITADTGAAVADMKNILSRRYPLAEILIYPSLVQGPGAPEELASGIRYFNKRKNADTIIIGRGGGSIEDLWAFNSEMLAHEIFASEIPVISAVGHETDFTICDFVADLRAPTPSAAAELAVPDISEVSNILYGYSGEMKLLAEKKLSYCKSELARLSSHKMLRDPMYYTEKLKERVARCEMMLNASAQRQLQLKKGALSERASMLSALSPLSVIERGYSIVTDANGKTISNASKLSVGDKIDIRFGKGKAVATINEIQKGAK